MNPRRDPRKTRVQLESTNFDANHAPALLARSAAYSCADHDFNVAERDDERPYERLAGKIVALISRGELAAGDRVPSERELAERYRVSRTAIREARQRHTH